MLADYGAAEPRATRRCYFQGVWLVVGISCSLLPSAHVDAQSRPLALEQIENMVRSGVADERIQELVTRTCVIDDGSLRKRLAGAGASRALIELADANVCAAAAPAPRPSPQVNSKASRAVLGMGFGDEQFAEISPGTFTMGSFAGYIDEQPTHAVTITRSFLLQRTEVTQGQWRAVMGGNPSAFSSCGDVCPVERVSWEDVQLFLRRLNAASPDRNYRLPTEAEWEYAARAGTTGNYGGSGDLDDMGWWKGNAESTTHPVATKRGNAWGLFDMHGNVLEWVADWYGSEYYGMTPRMDPTGPTDGYPRNFRVMRGGSWSFHQNYARSAHRAVESPSYRSESVGFRLARTP